VVFATPPSRVAFARVAEPPPAAASRAINGARAPPALL
jgi:hypothetical protein